MKVIVDVCIVPIGEGVSVRKHVAAVQKLIQQSGLTYQLHGYGTNIEGEWDAVFGLIKQCHQALHDSGVVRLNTTLKLGTRTDKSQSIQDKIDAVS